MRPRLDPLCAPARAGLRIIAKLKTLATKKKAKRAPARGKKRWGTKKRAKSRNCNAGRTPPNKQACSALLRPTDEAPPHLKMPRSGFWSYAPKRESQDKSALPKKIIVI